MARAARWQARRHGQPDGAPPSVADMLRARRGLIIRATNKVAARIPRPHIFETMASTQKTIEDKLARALAPAHLEVLNESDRHNVPPGSESHFRVTVVSDAFEGVAPLDRHRCMNKLLADELSGGVHALALHALTPAEWEARGGAARASPPCLGGDRAKAREQS